MDATNKQLLTSSFRLLIRSTQVVAICPGRRIAFAAKALEPAPGNGKPANGMPATIKHQ